MNKLFYLFAIAALTFNAGIYADEEEKKSEEVKKEFITDADKKEKAEDKSILACDCGGRPDEESDKKFATVEDDQDDNDEVKA
jgi:hypothetical protein